MMTMMIMTMRIDWMRRRSVHWEVVVSGVSGVSVVDGKYISIFTVYIVYSSSI